ncbi:carbohydrate-binding protein [Chitinophaga sp. RAB17]|uniref:carbohydrate-binding protein n=1 Tax=Chitinophaga sp. RAB17 TaxID=3233049 RepID=UPI003F8F29BA
MKKTLLLVLCSILLCNILHAQYLLLDDMEGHGPCSGRWSYYAGAGATGSVLFHVANPAPSSVNPSPYVAKFTKDTSCFEYMSASCPLTSTFDLSSNSTFNMLVYSNVKEEIMFKLQPGSDYTKAVFFTYKVTNINQWEEATFNFQSVKNRTDLNNISVQFIDGKKANGILYFDLVQAPNPVGITLTNTRILMGQENGAIIPAKLNGAAFKPTLNKGAWSAANLPPGVTIDSIQRVNDTIANIVLAGNSAANYSKRTLQLSVAGTELDTANTPFYMAKGNAVFEGNPAWTMIFGDEFNTGGLPDRTKWTVDPRPKGWINGEQQVYTDTTHDNIRVRNGDLVITGKKDFPNGNTTEPWSSGRLISQGKMDFTYGKVEVRAKLPKARGSWPAIWLMPTTSAYGAWPRSGELDIMEHVGNNLRTVLSTVHTQNNNWTNGGHLSASRVIPDVNTAYHVYAMEWSADSLIFTYDSSRVYAYANPQTDWKDWPFDQKFHVILNLAIGGGMGGTITEADWPDSMNVDYVRIYQKGLGTPVLDTILVAPANQVLLPGKSIQYTATANDQNGRPITISPVWSITGAGNTITTGGLATFQSSGTITATATVDSVTRSTTTYANIRPTNYKPIPARIEAEAFDNSNTCCTEPAGDTSGAVNVSYIGKGSWMEYDIDVPDSAMYRIQFRVAVSTVSNISVQLDTTNLVTMNLPVSGGWQNWSTVSSPAFKLKKGRQTIRIYANTSGWNFNWLKFIPANAVALNSITVAPDSVSVTALATKQFTANGFDQFGDKMAITPEWKVNNSFTMINQAGLFTAADTSGYFTIQARDCGVTGTATVKVLPLPVLTRIRIFPDTVTIPVTASYTFTAKGYDQLDSTMILPSSKIWAVTGAGNSINANGVLTAGNTTGNYQVTLTAGAIRDTANISLVYGCTVNSKYEAESASSISSGPVLEACTDEGGGQNYKNLYAGHWFAYSTLNVPVARRYNISLRVLSTAPSQASVGHGGQTFGTINIPSTGGVWKTIKDTITLPALSYTGIHVVSGTFKFNWFSIDDCVAPPPPPLARIELTPGDVSLPVRSAQQFTAKGYDADSNEVILAAPVWSVTGAGNVISAGGLFTADTTIGNYTVTVTAGGISKTATIHIAEYNCSVNNKYEAESASARISGPVLETCTDVGGGQDFTNLKVSDWFAYNNLVVPTAGKYTLRIRVSTTAPAQVGIGNGGVVFGVVNLPNTGGTWQTISDTVTLPALTYTGILVRAGTFKYNWFIIDNCTPIQPLSGMTSAVAAPFKTITLSKTRVYPNPFATQLTIEFQEAYHTATLIDITGKVIQQWKIAPGTFRMNKNLGNLRRGMYLLTLEGRGKSEVIKVIKL